jgi:hypothetical protein
MPTALRAEETLLILAAMAMLEVVNNFCLQKAFCVLCLPRIVARSDETSERTANPPRLFQIRLSRAIEPDGREAASKTYGTNCGT